MIDESSINMGQRKIAEIEQYLSDAKSGKIIDPDTMEPYTGPIIVDEANTWKNSAQYIAKTLDMLIDQVLANYGFKSTITTDSKEVMKWILAGQSIQYRPIHPGIPCDELDELSWVSLDTDTVNFSEPNEYRITPSWLRASTPYEAHHLWQATYPTIQSRLQQEEAAFLAGSIYREYQFSKKK